MKKKILVSLISALVIITCSCKKNVNNDQTESTLNTADAGTETVDYDTYEITGDSVTGESGISYSYVIKSNVIEYHDTVVFRYDMKYPVFEGNNEETVSEINAYANQKAESFVSDLKKSAEEICLNLGDDEIASFAPYSASLEVGVTLFSDRLLSMKCSAGSYEGGMHESLEETGATFGLDSGELKSLSNFVDKDYAADYIINEAKTSDKADMLFDGFEEKLKQLVSELDSFYLTGDGICIVCPEYVIAPYAAGAFVFYVPVA